MGRFSREQLTDLAAENIDPVRLEEDFDYQNTNLDTLYDKINQWVDTAVKRTINDSKERGFKIDSIGNIFGIFKGNESSITFPRDYARDTANCFHTHPIRTLDGEDPFHLATISPSSDDIRTLASRYGFILDTYDVFEKELKYGKNEYKQVKPRSYIISSIKDHRYSTGNWICILRVKLQRTKQHPNNFERALDEMWSKGYGLEDTENILSFDRMEDPLSNLDNPKSRFKPSIARDIDRPGAAKIISAYSLMREKQERITDLYINHRNTDIYVNPTDDSPGGLGDGLYTNYEYLVTKPSEPIDL